jgi:hypothetical protein
MTSLKPKPHLHCTIIGVHYSSHLSISQNSRKRQRISCLPRQKTATHHSKPALLSLKNHRNQPPTDETINLAHPSLRNSPNGNLTNFSRQGLPLKIGHPASGTSEQGELICLRSLIPTLLR